MRQRHYLRRLSRRLVAERLHRRPAARPSVMALPGQGKNMDAFQQDDFACRQYASQQTGGASPSVGCVPKCGRQRCRRDGARCGRGCRHRSRERRGRCRCGHRCRRGPAGRQCRRRQQCRRRLWRRPATLRCQLHAMHDRAWQHRAAATDWLRRVSVPGLPLSRLPLPRLPVSAYPYGLSGYYGPAFFAPSVAIGFGGGWGWRGRRPLAPLAVTRHAMAARLLGVSRPCMGMPCMFMPPIAS